MIQRRANEAARRARSRAMIPPPITSEERQAESKYTVAKMLYRDGRTDASRRVLERLLQEYSATQVADRARYALARF
jgi:TolA-binding protein